jgi:hypothetical protein
MKAKFMMFAVTLGLILSMNVHAAPENKPQFSGITTTFKEFKPGIGFKPGFGFKGHPVTKAPEISAESAAIAIALISGILLLVSERSRTRRI